MRNVFPPPWRADGSMLLGGSRTRPILIAEFKMRGIPAETQKASCLLASKAPAMAQALFRLEDELGDLPNGPVTQKIYAIVEAALKDLQLTRLELEGGE